MNDKQAREGRPLCVDLDGTLVRTDTFAQALLQLVRQRPMMLFSLPRLASGGLAAFKRRVAERVRLDPAALPYPAPLLELLRTEKGKGRTLLLVTASDQRMAEAVAAHTGLFDEVLASDGTTNLKAGKKRDALVARFGEKGFDYAGNAADDLPVWAAAARVLAVNPSGRVRRSPFLRGAMVLDDRPPWWRSWANALRIRQWLKNSLIFLPMLLAHELANGMLYVRAALAFASFSLAASAVYVLNDLFDLHADQRHPRKKERPFAAGHLSLATAVAVLPLLLAGSLALAWVLPSTFLTILLAYLLVTTLYSLRLKQIALLDVIILAGLYSIRIIAGSAAYRVETSTWLIAFSIFVFFSLALVKRYAELREAADGHAATVQERGRGYAPSDLPLLAAFGAGSGCVAVLVLALYINSEKVTEFYVRPHMLWLLCPLFLYWIARIWLLAVRGVLSDDPLEFAARDPATWLVAAFSAATLVLAAL